MTLSACKRFYPQIAVASWCFGSAKDGVVLQGSDLDIAVLFSSLTNFEQLAELRADLQDALEFDTWQRKESKI